MRASHSRWGSPRVPPMADSALSSLRCDLFLKLNQDLGVPLDPLVEFVVGLWCLVDVNAMTDDLARLRPSIHNQIAKILVVLLDRRLSASHGYALIEEISNGKGIDAFLCV